MRETTRHFSVVLIGIFVGIAGFCSSKQTIGQSDQKRFEFSVPSMGSQLDFVVYSKDPNQVDRSIKLALQEIERLSLVLSNYDAASEISRLNESPMGKRVVLSADLAKVLYHSQRWNALSGGRFDITVGPITELWRKSRKQKQLPDMDAMSVARRSCGFALLDFSRNLLEPLKDASPPTVQLLAANMKLDLSGLAVGYILDRALETMIANGTASVLINAGGDIRVGDSPPGKSGWRITVASLGKGGPPLSSLNLQNCAVTTSGDLFQFVEIDGHRYSHFIDPITGTPIERRQSVTVIASTAIDADAGATALAVMGMELACEKFDTMPLTEAILVENSAEDLNLIRMRYLKESFGADSEKFR